MTTIAEHRRVVRELCGVLGVERGFRSNDGRWSSATDAALLGVLAALGVATGSDEELSDDLAARRRAAAARLLAPGVVVEPGRSARVPLGPIAPAVARSGSLDVVTGSGEHLGFRLADVLEGERDRDGRGGVLDLRRLGLPIGIHTITISGRRTEASAHCYVRPPRAGRPRRGFGVFAPLYGVRSAQDWGVGSTGELGRLVEWSLARGASFVATLPLYPCFYDEQFEVSPYLPVSRVAWNEIYIDVERQPEIAVAPEAANHLATPTVRREIERLRAASRVEYREVARRKREALEMLAAVVDRGPRAARFRAFVADSETIRQYARFRADHEGGPSADRARARRYHEYVQFVMDEAMSGLSDLYLDLPVGVHPDGFDQAHFSSAFVRDASIGSPPDDFFPKGQNWSMPPPHPERTRDDGHTYWRATLRHIFRHATVVRVDHVMGLERYFVIPAGHDPSDGAYVRSPSRELRAVLAIEAAVHATTVLGEDLGTVPPETHRAMARDGMLRSFVYEIEAGASRPAPRSPTASMASFGTHDLPRLAGFLAGADLGQRVTTGAFTKPEAEREAKRRARLRLALIARGDAERGTARALRGFLAWLARTDADLAFVDLGDLVLDPEPENQPGPDSGATSWRHRLPIDLETLSTSPTASRRLAAVAAGRSHHRREQR